MKHEHVWNAVDKLAKLNGLSPSGLAKKADLDSTTFNKSKRVRSDGKKRFPSLESINKIIGACNITFEQFYKLVDKEINDDIPNSIPYIKFSSIEKIKSNTQNDIDTLKWNRIKFPDSRHNLYAVELDYDNDSIFKNGTTLILSQNSEIRRGDKVLIQYKDGSIFIGQFVRRTATTIEISDLTNVPKDLALSINDISYINRILWVSQ